MIPVPDRDVFYYAQNAAPCSPTGHADIWQRLGRQHNAARTCIRAVDVPEPLQRIRTQGETEAGPVRRMHHAVQTDVEWLVEELPHHGHVPLAHLENVAVGGCHRHVNACSEQNATAPGMWG